jgi:threonine-phosphate decarboxylase
MTNYEKFLELKSSSGLHSPSIFEMTSMLNVDIKVDACFLCNPYAFDLFCDYYRKTDITDYFKYYPPQNKTIAKGLGKYLDINTDYLLLGNGAIQLIELILREMQGKRKCIITPTFSSYYEFDEDNIFYYRTHKENNFKLDENDLIQFCQDNNIETLVIVNPNNPTGISMNKASITKITKALPKIVVILDESFIDFYDRKNSMEKDVYANPNLIVIRSLSKDFGIAGLRLGYAIMSPKRREDIMSKYGLLWNINGIAYFFIETLQDKDFQQKYDIARDKYLQNKREFYEQLSTLDHIKVYNSDANFFIVDCFDRIDTIFSDLLFEHGIYTRILNDKLHLDITFLRIACGRKEDNDKIFESLKQINNK